MQSTRKFKVANYRNTVYDCNGLPLTNTFKSEVTVVFPTEQGVASLPALCQGETLDNSLEILKDNTPVVINTECPEGLSGVLGVSVPKRYNGSLSHLLGYVDADSRGISGIEKTLDRYLFVEGGLTVTYKTDSLGHMLSGAEIEIKGNEEQNSVTLTIDNTIQKICESAMENVESGAAVVVDAENGKVRALLSKPDFDPLNIADYLNDQTSPLINRALLPFDVGSVFKPCLAAAALKTGFADYIYSCVGDYYFDGNTFKCNRLSGHGNLDLKTAIAKSCNTYFYTLGQNLGAENILKFANTFRFGQPIDLGYGISSAKGTVPSKDTLLQNEGSLINLSIGQGELMLSPIALTTMYMSIVNGGEYYLPSVIEGVTENGIYKEYQTLPPTSALAEEHAEILKEYLFETLKSGTGSEAYFEGIKAGGKTGTAQTGKKKDGRNILNGWFCGFVETIDTTYVIVVLKEDVLSGGADCSPIFKNITVGISNM